MSSEERVRVETEDHVTHVTMIRGDKHNALDVPMFEALVAAAAEVARTPGVRAVILSGEGKSFCSGLDIAAVAAAGGTDGASSPLLARTEGQRGNLAQRVALCWRDLPVPVIAAIHGNCLGGGLQVALGADIRLCAPDAKLSIREIHWGLVPDMGITETLPPLMGADRAKLLAYTGEIVSGERARDLGLVSEVADDPPAAARELAAAIAGRSPDAVRAAKRLLDAGWAAGPQLELETELQLGLIGSPNQIAAGVAGITGEPPQFSDPV